MLLFVLRNAIDPQDGFQHGDGLSACCCTSQHSQLYPKPTASLCCLEGFPENLKGLHPCITGLCSQMQMN